MPTVDPVELFQRRPSAPLRHRSVQCGQPRDRGRHRERSGVEVQPRRSPGLRERCALRHLRAAHCALLGSAGGGSGPGRAPLRPCRVAGERFRALKAGYQGVMLETAHLAPADALDSIRELVSLAARSGAFVEAELEIVHKDDRHGGSRPSIDELRDSRAGAAVASSSPSMSDRATSSGTATPGSISIGSRPSPQRSRTAGAPWRLRCPPRRPRPGGRARRRQGELGDRPLDRLHGSAPRGAGGRLIASTPSLPGAVRGTPWSPGCGSTCERSAAPGWRDRDLAPAGPRGRSRERRGRRRARHGRRRT
jgi:hypothetical protein